MIQIIIDGCPRLTIDGDQLAFIMGANASVTIPPGETATYQLKIHPILTWLNYLWVPFVKSHITLRFYFRKGERFIFTGYNKDAPPVVTDCRLWLFGPMLKPEAAGLLEGRLRVTDYDIPASYFMYRAGSYLAGDPVKFELYVGGVLKYLGYTLKYIVDAGMLPLSVTNPELVDSVNRPVLFDTNLQSFSHGAGGFRFEGGRNIDSQIYFQCVPWEGKYRHFELRLFYEYAATARLKDGKLEIIPMIDRLRDLESKK